MKYHLITLGCQMNQNESERIAAFFEENGMQKETLENADIVVINACSIRKSATDKIHGKMKNIRKMGKKTVLTGCVLKEDLKKMEKMFDYMLESHDVANWPFFNQKKDFFQISPKRKGPSALVSIMTGCDNFCSYCVVPHTKGREKSRNWKEVVEEVKKAVAEGVKEIWLLGQNVNSYSGGTTFDELLRKINEIEGDFWIRFTSSHPKDFSNEVIKAISECDKVTEYLNLPVQSGDNKILKAMNRPYTVEEYKEIINSVKKTVPGIVLSTDIIVGFPGETESNFRNTVKLFMEVEFEMAYISCYSPRPGTVAEKIKDNISLEEKKRREKVLTELLKEITLSKNEKYKGEEVDVLVLKSKKNLLMGKTRGYKSVTFEGPQKLVGNFAKVKITKVSPWGLKGKLLS